MSVEKARATPKPTDERGDITPWLTYGAIKFLKKNVKPNMCVFEYGAGASTVWWAKHAMNVWAVEHNRDWAETTRLMLVERDLLNAIVSYVELEPDGEYCRMAVTSAGFYDVIVIDGRDRVNCATHAFEALARDGVIVWDNTERKKYRPGFQFLLDKGFKALHFEGPGPLRRVPWRTTIFYRPDNCMGIK